MDTLILFHVEILGNQDEPSEAYCIEATSTVPIPGTTFSLSGPKRDLTGQRSKPDAFYAIAQKEDYLFLPQTSQVIIRLEDDECLRNKRRKPHTLIKEYIKHGWKKMEDER